MAPIEKFKKPLSGENLDRKLLKELESKLPLKELGKYISKESISSMDKGDIDAALKLVVKGDIPVFYKALCLGNIELAKNELANKDINKEVINDEPVLLFAINNNPELVNPLIELGADVSVENRDGCNLFHLAVLSNDINAVVIRFSSLSEEQIFQVLTHQNKEGNSPFHLLANKYGLLFHYDPTYYTEKQKEELKFKCRLLLDSLSEEQIFKAITAENNNGDTPLHLASKYNNVYLINPALDCIKKSLGEDKVFEAVTYKDGRGNTSLHAAVDSSAQPIKYSIWPLLKGLDDVRKAKAMSVRNENGDAPLILFEKSGHKANKETKGEIKKLLDKLNGEGVKVLAANKAVYNYSLYGNKFKEQFVKASKEIDDACKDLHQALEYGHFKEASELIESNENIANSLVNASGKYKANSNLSFNKGEPILSGFIKEGNLEAAKFLIDHEAVVRLKDLRPIEASSPVSSGKGLAQYFSKLKDISVILEEKVVDKLGKKNNYIKSVVNYAKGKDQISLSKEAKDISAKIMTYIAKNVNVIEPGDGGEERNERRVANALDRYLAKAFDNCIKEDENGKFSISQQLLDEIIEAINTKHVFSSMQKFNEGNNRSIEH